MPELSYLVGTKVILTSHKLISLSPLFWSEEMEKEEGWALRYIVELIGGCSQDKICLTPSGL